MTQIIGGHNLGLLDGSLGNLNRNDRTRQGSLPDGVSAFVNAGNGNLVYQERDAFLPSLGADFDLVRSYNSRGVIAGGADGWSYSTSVRLESHNDTLAGGGTQRAYTVTYGDLSELHFDRDAANNRWVSTDGAGAYEVLTELPASKTDPAAFLVVRADQSQYRFDKGGALLSITDPNGVTMSFTYQGGKLRTVQDDSGHTITFDQQGGALQRITKTSATDGSVVTLMTYGYTGSQLTSVTDRMGHVTRYSYDSNGMLVGVSLPFQQTVGGVAQTWEQRNLSFSYERFQWDDNPHVVTPFDRGFSYILRSMTDPQGGVTSFDYAFQFATGTMAPGDRDLAYAPNGGRDFQGGSTRVVDALGNARATSNAPEYVAWRSANGFYATYGTTSPQAQVDAIRNAHSLVYTVDANSQITEVVDALGYKTTYAYDAKGNLASTTDRNGFAAVSRDDQQPGDGYYRQQRVALGLPDQPISWFTAQPNWLGTLRPQILARYTTTYGYDAAGNRTSEVDGAGNRTTSTYTSFNKVATTTSATGNALAESNSPLMQAKRVELGYPAGVASLSTAQAAALRSLYTTSYTYDARQNLVRRVDAGGDVTNFAYDASGNLVRREVLVPAVAGNPAQTQVTTYSYDAYGNVRETRDGENFVSTQVFDTFGNLLSAVDPRGGVSSFSYDADNRLLTARTPEGRTTANAYDAVGNVIAVTDFAGKTVTQVFDRNNMLVATIDPALSDAARTRSTSFNYDILGNRTRITDAEGRVTTYRYDARRLMIDVTTAAVLNADEASVSYVTSYAYDGEGNVVTSVDNNRNTTQTSYDSIGLTRRITDPTGNVTEFVHDPNKMRVQVVVGAQLAAPLRRVLNYSYDEEDQLVKETDALGGSTLTQYDAVGNVVATTDENSNTNRFTFDRNNRLVKETFADGSERLHAFDGNGNEVKTTDENGNVSFIRFDKDDRRVMVTDGNGIHTVFEYDSRGNQTRTILGADASYDALTARVVLGDLTQARVESYRYDEFSELVAQTDAVGWALANSNSPAARAMRLELRLPELAADLSATQRDDLLKQYTETYTYDRVGNRLTTTDHLGRVSRQTYDALDRVQSSVQAAGTPQQISTQLRYDGNDNIVRSVDPLGRVTRYTYDAMDRQTSVVDPAGTLNTSEYDHVGNRLADTLAAGTPDERRTTYLYDLNDRLVSQTDPRGHTIAYQYDAVGNRTRVVDARLGATRYVYDARNRNIEIRDPMGLSTKMVYDGVGNQIRMVDPKGGVRELTYDFGNRYIQTRDAEGRVTRFAYDRQGNQVAMTTAYGLPEAQTTTYLYDAEGKLRATTDALGITSRLGYDAVYNEIRSVDANGHVTTTTYDALNRVLVVTDPLRGTVSYGYDPVGNKLTEKDERDRVRSFAYDELNRVVSETDALGVVTTYAYDRVGNRTQVTRAAGRPEERSITFVYDTDDLLVEQIDSLGESTFYEHDANHNVVRTTDARGNATHYTYDANDRLKTITDPLGGVTEYRYDANGNRSQVIDARGSRTTYYYNAVNEIVRTIDTLGFVTSRSYDGNGNVLSETRHALPVAVPLDPELPPPAVVTSPQDRTEKWSWDALNRMVKRTSPLGFETRMAYDAVGNKTSEVDALGRRSSFEYDDNDRLVRSVDPLGGVVERSYDAVGNLVSLIDELGRTETYEYDSENRLLRTVDALNGERKAAYDAVGNLVSEIDELGRETTYTYDANDRRISRVDAKRGESFTTYDAVGNVTSETDELGRVTSFKYDAKNRLIERIDAKLQSRSFEYDANDNLVAEVDELGRTRRTVYDLENRPTSEIDARNQSRGRTYDAVGNVVSATDERGFTTTFAYDADNRQISRTDPYGNTSRMGWDAVGNRISSTDENGHTTAYAYDDLNRLTSTTLPLNADNVIAYTYDAVGNRTSETDQNGHSTTFQYDALNRLEKRINAMGDERSWTYDAVGNRLSEKDERGAVTRTEYDVLNRPVAIVDAKDGRREMSYDAVGNRIEEIDEKLQKTRFAYDALDRVTSQIDPMGFERKTVYDAVGNEVSVTDANGNVYAMTYDANNRMTEQRKPIGTLKYEYDAAGNVTRQTDETDGVTKLEYDRNNRLISREDPLGGKTRYEYDPKGNKTAEIDENDNAATYLYDKNDRVIAIVDGEGFRSKLFYDAVGNVVRREQQLDKSDPTRVAVTTQEFDDLNRMVGVLTADGRLMRYEFDATGNLVSKTEYDAKYPIPPAPAPAAAAAPSAAAPSLAATASSTTALPEPTTGDDGRTTSYEYDLLGRVTSTTTPGDLTTVFEYDATGNLLTTRSNPDLAGERVESTVYDDNGRIVEKTDAMGTVTKFVLDNHGNVLEQHVAYGRAEVRVTRWEYDANHRVKQETDAAGYVTTFEYNDAGDMVLRKRAGREEKFEYDANHRLTAEINGEGERTEYDYDGAGNRKEIRSGVTATGTLRTQKFEYDNDNHLTLETDGNGIETRHVYDGAGNRRQTIQNAGAASAADQRVTFFDYDDDNRLIRVTNPEGGVTTYGYDAEGNQNSIKLPDGSVTRSTFDAKGRVLSNTVDADGAKGGIKTVNTYDVHGNVTSTTVSWGDGSEARTTTYEYDALDRQTRVTDALGFSTTFEYDRFGNQIAIQSGQYLLRPDDTGYDGAKAALAHPTRIEFSFDKLDRLVLTKQFTNLAGAQGDFIAASYDAWGNRLTQTTGAGTPGARTVKFQYDQADRVVRRESAEGGVVLLAYDEAGNQTGKRQLQSGTEAAGQWIVQEFEYDGNGVVRLERNYLNATTAIVTEYVVDAFGNEVEVIVAKDTPDERRTVSVFDSNNELVSRTEAAGTADAQKTDYVVDAAGRVIREIDALGRVTRLYYDGAGRQVGTLDPSGYYTQMVLDPTGNVLEARVYLKRYVETTPEQYDLQPPTPLDSDVPQITRNTFDKAGNRIEQLQSDGTRLEYVYDANRKLVRLVNHGSSDTDRVARTASNAALELKWTYDDALRLKSFVNADGSVESYGYDASNNKISESVARTGTLANGRSDPVRTTTFKYDGDNRLIEQVFDPGRINRIEKLAYDKAGNVISKTDARGGVTLSTYDALNRLVSVKDPTGAVTSFGYDRVGNQTRVTDPLGRVTDLYYDKRDNLVRQVLPAVDVFTIDGGLQTGVRPETRVVFDAVGNVVQEIDENGGKTTRWYDESDKVVAELSAEGVLRTVVFDANGNASSTTLYMSLMPASAHDPRTRPVPPTGEQRTTRFFYDAGNRFQRVALPEITVTTLSGTGGDSPTATSAAASLEKVSSYDRFGNLVTTSEPGGLRTWGWYDALGRQVASVDSAGYLIESDYDSQGNVVQQRRYVNALDTRTIDPAIRPQGSGAVAVTDRIYDAANRLVEEVSPTIVVATGETLTAAEKVRTLYGYDVAGNRISRTLAAGTTDEQVEYTWYDAANRPALLVSASRTAHTFGYDLAGNQTEQVRYINPLPASLNVATATYDQVRLAIVKDEAQDQVTTLGFDALNRLVSQTQRVAGGGYSTIRLTTDHDAIGNETRKTDGSGNATLVEYDADGKAVRTVTPDGVTSFVEYNAAGEKVRAWTGVLGANGAQAATSISAVVDGELRIGWQQGGTNVQSWVVWDTQSRPDDWQTTASTDDNYVNRTGSQSTGSVSAAISLAGITAGTRLYFRIVSQDSSGSQAWTEERQLVVPARATALSTQRVGSNVQVTVTFNGTVTSPTLRYDDTTALANTAALQLVSGNTWRASIPAAEAGFFTLAWNAGGTGYTTEATAFDGTGVHRYDATTGTASWSLPVELGAQQGASPSQVILIDGQRLDSGFTYNNVLQFQPEFTSNGTRTLDVLYGSRVSTTHTGNIFSVDRQTATVTEVSNRNADNVETSRTRTYTYAHDYETSFSVTLNAAETARVGAAGMKVAWRSAGTGTAFTGEFALTRASNTFSGTFDLAPGTYDFKIFYVDTNGREVVVEWKRTTVSTAPLEATVTRTDSTAPFDFADVQLPPLSVNKLTNNLILSAANSVVVLATETGGSFAVTGNGSNVAITAGRYSGPLSAGKSAFTLGLTTTTGSQGGQRGANGLVSATYFTEIEYNALGMKVASNEDDGLWRRYGVDASGNKVRTDLYGTRAAEVAGLTPITTYAAYDPRGLETARWGAAVLLDNGTTKRQVTRTAYDWNGQVLSRQAPNGASTRYTYDLSGNRVTETDAVGNLTRYTYNRLGSVVAVLDPLEQRQRRVYDSAGRLVQEIDALGKSTTYTNDAFGRMVTRTDAVGNVTRYKYDQRDRLIEMTDAEGQVAKYAYDQRDNRTSTIDVARQTLTTTFDKMNRITSQASSSAIVSGGAAVEQKVSYEYDAYGNRIKETDASGRTKLMTYGLNGRLTTLTDEGGRLTEFGYDRFSRQISETRETTGDGTPEKKVERSYNDAGWLLKVTDSGVDTGKPETTYTYDIAGERKTEKLTQLNASSVRETLRDIAYLHDDLGRLTGWTDSAAGVNQNLKYEWDAAGNQKRISGSSSTDNVYKYDKAGRVTSIEENGTVAVSYTYDDAGRRATQTQGGSTLTFTYDKLDRVVKANDGTRDRMLWTYDALGNVLTYTEYKADGTKLRENINTYFENGLAKTSFSQTFEDVGDDKKKKQTTTSEYDASKRLVKQTMLDETDPDNKLTFTYAYTYTADGRTTSVTASGSNNSAGSSTSSYNANDQLILINKGQGDGREGAETLTFRYDNDGKIVSRLHDDGENDTTTSPLTRFMYAEGQPVGETGTNTSNGTVTLLDENGESGDKQDMQYREMRNIDRSHPSSSTSTYNVRAGDSLQSVAAAVYGNPSLWFLIADANGLTGDSALKAGQVLQVPTSLEPGRLTADAHVLYKESDIIGSKLPNVQTPSSGSNTCALVGAIIGLILVAILAVVLTAITAGLAAPAAIAALGLTAGSLGAIIVTVAVTAVIGAAFAAAASAISQGILIGAGLQKSFDWKQFAADVAVGFISGAVQGLGAALQVVKIASTIGKVANVVAQGVLEAAGEVVRQAIANDGVIDNPWTILAAGLGGSFGAVAARAVRAGSQAARKLGKLLDRRVLGVILKADDAANSSTGKAVRLASKTRAVIIKGINKVELGKLNEGVSIFKTATTKIVKSVDDVGRPILKEVDRVANLGGNAATTIKKVSKDIKLVRIGDDIFEQQRISAQFTRLERVVRNLKSFAWTAVQAVKSVGKGIKAAVLAVPKGFKAIPKVPANIKKGLTSLVKSFKSWRDARTSIQQGYEIAEKGYATLSKGKLTKEVLLAGGAKQTFMRTSKQFTRFQRFQRWAATNGLLKYVSPKNLRLGKGFADGLEEGTKVVRVGTERVFDGVSKSYREFPKFATKPRVGFKAGLKLNVQLVKDAVSEAQPFTKAKLFELGVGIGKTVALSALRDYKDDRVPQGYVTSMVKGAILEALKQPREDLNNWLLTTSNKAGGIKDFVASIDESDGQALNSLATSVRDGVDAVQLKLSKVRQTLYGVERNHGWYPMDRLATGTNVLSRVQSPIDLDYAASYEQRLRTSQMTAGQTAQFSLRSVFEFAADLDGRITDNKIPLQLLNTQPPMPAPMRGN